MVIPKLVESASLKLPSRIESISRREYSQIIDVVKSRLYTKRKTFSQS